jgi:Kef-type K+ transport system membrane component KefB
MNHVMNLVVQIAIILLLANILRAFSIKLKFPPVIALIFLGIVLGPSLLNFAQKEGTIEWIAQIGVLFLIFEAGIQTNLKKLKEESKKAVLPSLGGVIFPFLSGFLLSYFFHFSLVSSLFIGAVFTATSISISVITLMDIDKLTSIEGRCIVNSAIIDDVLGILLISFIFGLSIEKSSSATIYQSEMFLTIIRIIFYFIVAFVVGLYLIPSIFINSRKLNIEGSMLSVSVVVIFFYSWFAEMSGLAAITGAYLAGLFIGQTEYRHLVNTGISQVGKTLFIDFFFIGIGLTLHLKELSIKPLFLILFVILAIISKFFGSAFGARLAKFDTTRSSRIGFGMIPRGEVALIMASMGISRDLVSVDVLSATVLMVIISSLAAPFLIRYSYTKFRKETF